MLEKHRSLRGTLTSKIKESVFAVFGENILLPINTKASALENSQWKSSKNVRRCYTYLFQLMAKGSNISYMARII
ncbi:2729_t:CDS:1 [Funneliformis geosporum]|uniref:2729_t:CDS:1 n=1 Tax=Funneliformis geosporum TaxID=1117311 RepID=A0A9W4TDB8_9GLOM|nr:2729_t:CDS:1 [Funneliformis geosporum]